MKTSATRIALVLGLLTGPLLAACGSDAKPTVAEWTEGANAICGEINDARGEAASASFPSADEPPTVDQLQVFLTAFEPKFRGATERMGELDRPSSIAADVEEFVTAGREFADYLAAAAADDTIAQNELDTEGDTEPHRALLAAGEGLDLTACEGG